MREWTEVSGLLYREDMDAARDRLSRWWNGGDIGRPALLLTVRREKAVEDFPVMQPPEGCRAQGYTTRSLEFRVNMAQRSCTGTHYLCESAPAVSPDLAPNCLALYLGCRGEEGENTVWCEPCVSSPDDARFDFDESNFYWNFTLRLAREQLRIGRGKFLTAFPDLIEGLDTLAAMRGTQDLLFDLIERPEWVHASLARITDRYFDYYDRLYDMIKDDRGGSHFWAWAPGRMSKLQCDISAMISPGMFGEFMVPVLKRMTERLDYCMYHWDGLGALPHHDHLLSLPRLSMIQWTPGAGVEPVTDRRWWPLYHKTIDHGKKVIILGCSPDSDWIGMRREFGPKLKQFMISARMPSVQHANDFVRLLGD